MVGCLALAAFLRLWHLPTTNGIGHIDYSAAAVSMSRNWTAFFTGGVETGNFLTIEKPAIWLWPSALLVKAFGVNWATLFLPTVVAGVASVLVVGLIALEASGGGQAGRVTALLAALGLAISPVSVAIDRVNSPDGVLAFVLLLAGWSLLRAVRLGRMSYLLGSAALTGLAFNVKYLAGFLVLPAFAVVWMVSGHGSIRRRMGWLAAAGGVLLASAAAWPLAVSLIPARRRPWFGGSTDGSVFSAASDSGLGRVLGQAPGVPSNAPPPGPGRQIFEAFQTGLVFHSGRPGPGRLFTGVLADQVAWLLPLAVLSALALAVSLRGRPRTDPAVAGLVLWSGWAACCLVVFSFMRGTLHPYYTCLLAPAIVALAASGLVAAWTSWRRRSLSGTVLLVSSVVVGAGWMAWVVRRSTGPHPTWLIPVIITAGALTVVAVLFAPRLSDTNDRMGTALAGALTAVAMVAPQLVWSAQTTTPQINPINPLANPTGRDHLAGIPAEASAAIQGALGAARQVDPGLLAYLREHRGGARWIVATPAVLQAGALIVVSGGEPVLPLGGFNGADPVPTLAEFQQLTATGQVRYLLVSGSSPSAPPGDPAQSGGIDAFGAAGEAARIRLWAEQTCQPVDPTSFGGASASASPNAAAIPARVLFDCAPG